MTAAQAFQTLRAGYKAEVAYRGGQYKEDESTLEHIKKAAEWLTNGHKPGILFCGLCGNGKTTLLNSIVSIINFYYDKNDRDPRIKVKQEEARELSNLAKIEPTTLNAITKEKVLAIDDLGMEPAEILNYGNVLSPMVDLLSYRYNHQLLTMVTTNLSPAQIREKYGDRIADRFNEMMDTVVFTNPTYRK